MKMKIGAGELLYIWFLHKSEAFICKAFKVRVFLENSLFDIFNLSLSLPKIKPKGW
jgi:hypothetical protein